MYLVLDEGWMCCFGGVFILKLVIELIMNINFIFFVQVLVFVGLIWIIVIKIWLLLMNVIEECQQKIVEGFVVVDCSQKDLVQVQEKVNEVLKEVCIKVNEIIDQVYVCVNQIVDVVCNEVIIEVICQKELVQVEIDVVVNCVCEDLCKQVFVLVVIGVEKLFKCEIDVNVYKVLFDELVLEI